MFIGKKVLELVKYYRKNMKSGKNELKSKMCKNILENRKKIDFIDRNRKNFHEQKRF